MSHTRSNFCEISAYLMALMSDYAFVKYSLYKYLSFRERFCLFPVYSREHWLGLGMVFVFPSECCVSVSMSPLVALLCACTLCLFPVAIGVGGIHEG